MNEKGVLFVKVFTGERLRTWKCRVLYSNRKRKTCSLCSTLWYFL